MLPDFQEFLKVQLPWNVMIDAENLKPGSLILQRAILSLLSDFAAKKVTKDIGYFLVATTLDKIGEEKVMQHTGDVLFPAVFNVVTLKIFKGEVLEGVVHKMLKHGVFVRIGPIKNGYPSSSKMLGYMYVLGENQISMNQKMPKIAKDVKVRVVVIGMKWMQAEREFHGLEGDYLGPISSPDMQLLLFLLRLGFIVKSKTHFGVGFHCFAFLVQIMETINQINAWGLIYVLYAYYCPDILCVILLYTVNLIFLLSIMNGLFEYPSSELKYSSL